MRKLIYLLLLASVPLFGQVTDAAMKTQADYIGANVFNPTKTKTLDYDLINNKVSYVGMVSATGTNTYAKTGLGAFTTIPPNFCIDVLFPADNTGASSFNINSIGAIPIVKGVSTALIAGDIKAGKAYRLFYDGTNFQISISGAAGSTGDVQLNLSGNTDATPNFNYDKTNNIFKAGTGITITGTGLRTNNFYFGLDHSNSSSGGGVRWNMLMGENQQINNSTSGIQINDGFLLGAYYNKLNVSSGSIAGLQNSGIVGSYNSIIDSNIPTNPGGFNNDIAGAIILGGQKNKISPSYSNGTIDAISGNWILGGGRNISDGHGSGAFGYWSQSSGAHSVVHGYVTTFFGGRQHSPDSGFDPDGGSLSHTGTIPRILASGKHAINMSANSPDQTSGFGATGDYSGIFAGVNGHVTGKNSVTLGGYKLHETDTATVQVPYLRLGYRPLSNDTIAHILTYDNSTGKVKMRTASSLSFSLANGNGSTANGSAVDLGGNLTANTIFNGGGNNFEIGQSGDELFNFRVYSGNQITFQTLGNTISAQTGAGGFSTGSSNSQISFGSNQLLVNSTGNSLTGDNFIVTSPANDNALTQLLVRDSGTGQVKYRSVSTITGTGAPTTRNINTTSPLSGGGDLSTDRTLSIANAAADGSTKGAASFNANDFDASSGNISIDYTNGQKATTSIPGLLTSTDWNTFNGKANSLTNGNGTTVNGTAIDLGGTASSDINIDDNAANTHDFNIGNVARFNNININATILTSFSDDIELNGLNGLLSLSSTGAVLGDPGGNTLLTLGPSTASFNDSRAAKKGIEYGADYSSTYTTRSLVDKSYVTSGTLSNTATLNFASTIATAVSDLTITVTGASVGDPCIVGVPNGSNTATATFTCWVSSSNTVTVRFSPKGVEDPASGTFKVSVIKY